MRRPALLWLALAAAAPAPPAAPAVRYFISPMGDLFQSATEDPLDLWFRSVDTDRNGWIDRSEMVADADRLFDRLDLDHDHRLDPDEIDRYEQDLRARTRGRGPGGGGSRPLAAYGLLDNPQPVMSADADMNRLVTRDEFEAAASRRFDLLDTNADGRLLRAELSARSMPPAKGRGHRALDSGGGRPHHDRS